MIEAWLAGLLEARADKRWTPVLYARAETIEHLVIEGYTISADEEVAEHTLEVRGEAYDEAGAVIGEEVKAVMTA